jgi:DNA polymerase III delta subunit
MITIFCGEDPTVSRKLFSEHVASLKEKGYEIAYGLDDVSYSSTLFDNKRAFVLENALNKKAERDSVIKLLADINSEIIFWEEAADERTLKRNFPKAKIVATKLSSSLWKLLDSFYPGNLQSTITTMRQIQDTNDIHLIHFMLMRRLKELLIVAQGGQPAKLASWQVGKLKSQARAWKPEMLESCFKKLVEIEMQTKSGTMVYELNKALEITFCFYL